MSDGSLAKDNKALVRRVIAEIWNGGKMELLDELVLPTFIRHHERNRDADLHGVAAFRGWVLAVREALPDLRLSIEQILGENDKVMVYLRGTGTHGGMLKGVAATGAPLAFTATAILRIAGGRVAEAWVIADTLGILQQIGGGPAARLSPDGKKNETERGGVMTTEANKIVIRRFYEEVMRQGRTGVLDEIMAEGFVDHGEALFGSPQGRETLRRGVAATHDILPDLNVQLEEIIAEGDLVGVRGVMRCTHLGAFLGVPGTGHELTWRGNAIFRVIDGKITERWFNSDSISILRQLELAPASGATDEALHLATAT